MVLQYALQYGESRVSMQAFRTFYFPALTHHRCALRTQLGTSSCNICSSFVGCFFSYILQLQSNHLSGAWKRGQIAGALDVSSRSYHCTMPGTIKNYQFFAFNRILPADAAYDVLTHTKSLEDLMRMLQGV